ncbi:hypothetical protein DFH27DRAFT_532572 [Peziza echinospora]|nr:hypothetical protein DFH27DRAFT_532572 [Peziza echinospora]
MGWKWKLAIAIGCTCVCGDSNCYFCRSAGGVGGGGGGGARELCVRCVYTYVSIDTGVMRGREVVMRDEGV